jgi:hypothetical protein
MAIKLEAAQLLLYRAATSADRGLPTAYETAIAKAACSVSGAASVREIPNTTAARSTRNCVELFLTARTG